MLLFVRKNEISPKLHGGSTTIEQISLCDLLSSLSELFILGIPFRSNSAEATLLLLSVADTTLKGTNLDILGHISYKLSTCSGRSSPSLLLSTE